MSNAWSYCTTVKPADASTASLALRATTPVPASADVVLASDGLDLQVQVYADGYELGAGSLLGSVVVEEMRSWLIKHQAALGIDRVDTAAVREGVLTIPLHAYTSSARAASLSQPDFTAATTGSSPKIASLAGLNVALRFLAPSKKLNKRQSTPIDDDEYAARGSGTPTTGDVQPTALAALLIATASRSTDLHFSLTPLLDAALTKLSKKLVVAFPLCFNSRWMTRLANDQAARRSLSSSLCSILLTACPDGAPADHRGGHELQDERVAREASLLRLTLQMRFGAGLGEGGENLVQSSSDTDNDAGIGKLEGILSRALLHIGQAYSTPDPWQLGVALASGAADTHRSTSFQAPAAKGNRQDRHSDESLRSNGYSEKIARRQQQLAEDVEDETLTSLQRPSESRWARSHDNDMELDFD